MFSKPEVDYLKTQHLARIATVSSKGQPDVATVAFEFDDKYFWVGSHNQEFFHRTRKHLNVKGGNKLVALTIDDMESITPWKPRGVKVYGTAEVIERNGQFGPGKYLRITPRISWAWGMKGLAVKEGELRLKTVHD